MRIKQSYYKCAQMNCSRAFMILDDFEQLVPFIVSRELRFPFYAGGRFQK